MEKLKSCPFCGVKAEFKCEPIRIKGTWCDAVYVHCKGCGARTNHVLYDAKLHSNGSEYQQVAAAWNRRAALENDYAALKARCDEINRYNISCTKKIDELRAEKISAPENKPLTCEGCCENEPDEPWREICSECKRQPRQDLYAHKPEAGEKE